MFTFKSYETDFLHRLSSTPTTSCDLKAGTCTINNGLDLSNGFTFSSGGIAGGSSNLLQKRLLYGGGAVAPYLSGGYYYLVVSLTGMPYFGENH